MTTRLMQAFDFSMEDLVANRHGKLTTHQQQIVGQHIRLAHTSSLLAVLAVFGSVLVFVGMAFFTEQGPIPLQAIPYLAGTALVLFAITGTFILIGLQRLRALRTEEITAVKGPVHLSTKRIKNGRWTGYYAEISDIRFQLTSERQFEALTEGQTCQIYFLHYPPTHLILSLEKLS